MLSGKRRLQKGARKRITPIRVLVVDDSAVVRQIMRSILSRDPNFTVIVAADPIFAMEKMKYAKPDVILLDLTMPRMDGLTFLRKIMSEDPVPVIVCSALTEEGSEAAMQALDEGAVEVVAKPSFGVADFLEESADEFIDTIYAAAEARVKKRVLMPSEVPQRISGALPTPLHRDLGPRAFSDKIIAIGASTGGTEALRLILASLPQDTPGMVIVQHMPENFTAPLARHLNQCSRLEIKEAAHGDIILRGTALIAPGNKHMEVARTRNQYTIQLHQGEKVCCHRPSVDVLFYSLAKVAGHNAVGAILTGMGEDGADGLLAMRSAGAATIAQDAETCVIFGMPKQAIAKGAVDEILSLGQIPGGLLQAADRKSNP